MPEGPASLTPEERRWPHDTFERLAAEENQLASGRTTYYAAIGTVLITGLVVTVSNFLSQPQLLIVVTTFLALLGILISVVWTVLLHRTYDAKNLGREAAVRLEQHQAALDGEWVVPLTLRSEATLPVDLFRPFQAQQVRFSQQSGISWMDRVSPDARTEVLPITFVAIWVAVLAASWIWFLVIR